MRFELQQTCGFAESDESPIYNIVYSTKIRISIDGREEIRTLLHLLEMKFTSIESPMNIHVLRLYIYIKGVRTRGDSNSNKPVVCSEYRILHCIK